MKNKILLGICALSLAAFINNNIVEASTGDNIYPIEPVSSVTYTLPKVFNYEIGKDKYLINYGANMNNQIVIKKNGKSIYKGAPITDTVGNVECISIRGKVFWRVTNKNKDFTKKQVVLLSEDNNDKNVRIYFDSKDFYAPDGYSFYEIISSAENHNRAKANSYLVEGDYLTAAFINTASNNFADIPAYYYILDYDKKNDKLVSVEAGDNKDFDAEVHKVHESVGIEDEKFSAKKIIKSSDNYRLVYQEINTGNTLADNAINNSIMNEVNTALAKTGEDGVVKVKMESAVTSENDKYISILSLITVDKGGNTQEYIEYGDVYDKANGQRIPLNLLADVDVDFVANKTFYRDLTYPNGEKYKNRDLIKEADRISDDYIINAKGQIILLYANKELVPAKYGRPGINVNKCSKINPYFLADVNNDEEVKNIYFDDENDEEY